jgi:hypothetical protein
MPFDDLSVWITSSVCSFFYHTHVINLTLMCQRFRTQQNNMLFIARIWSWQLWGSCLGQLFTWPSRWRNVLLCRCVILAWSIDLWIFYHLWNQTCQIIGYLHVVMELSLLRGHDRIEMLLLIAVWLFSGLGGRRMLIDTCCLWLLYGKDCLALYSSLPAV